MKDKSPAFQFYPKDYLTDTRVMVMDLAVQGAYCRALYLCWLENGSLPADPKTLSKLIGCNCTPRIAAEVIKMFEVDEQTSTMRHKRLDKEREKQEQRRKFTSAAGKVGMQKRWEKDNKTDNKVITEAITEPLQTYNEGDNGNIALQFSSSSSYSSADEIQPPPSDFKNLQKPISGSEAANHINFGRQLLTNHEHALILEQTQMTFKKLTIDQSLIDQFNGHLISDNKKHLLFNDWIRHLNNWLRANYERLTTQAKPANGIKYKVIE